MADAADSKSAGRQSRVGSNPTTGIENIQLHGFRERVSMSEFLEIVDREGRVISIAPRNLIHGNPSMLHKVVHVLVFNTKGEILLQKRGRNKDVAPGKWDTSVGGHVLPGEDLLSALKREMFEELGITPNNVRFLHTYLHSNEYESELVYTYFTLHEGPFNYNKEEIEEIAFWKLEDIHKSLYSGVFSDNFRDEFFRFIGSITNIPFWFNTIISETKGSPILPGDPSILKNF